jgi:MOSC domain-containing protein YiiM
MLWSGELIHIHVAGAAAEPMRALDEARLLEGAGIEADRYATRRGTYSEKHHIDRQLTLIEAETLEALARDLGIELAPHEHRRNLTTRGVPLNHLVGRYFSVGPCLLYGGRLNVPCRYLEQVTGKKVFKALVNRSGLNCRILVGGLIRPGDRIQPRDPGKLDPALRARNEAVPVAPVPQVW